MLIHSLLALVFPERCPACDAATEDHLGLCQTCSASLVPLGSSCPRCAEPQDTPVGTICSNCRRRPPAFDRVIAPWRYGGELATAIRRFKYGGRHFSGQRELARPIAALLAPTLDALVLSGRYDFLVAVPLHQARLRARGFSQAQVLAECALSRHGVPPRHRVDLLHRLRSTEEQAGLDRKGRRRNVAGAFEVRRARRTEVRQKAILLLDDVVTTGSTASACSRALKNAGAEEVDVLALARAEA